MTTITPEQATARTPAALAEAHQALLAEAARAVTSRAAFSGFAGREPSGPRGEDAAAQFAAILGRPLDLGDHVGTSTLQIDEVSPWTRLPLGVSYPRADAPLLVERALHARTSWRRLTVPERTGLCLEMIERLFAANPVLGLAAMHTTGQGRGMSLSGSGTNALDRGLEAIAAAWQVLGRVPTTATWEQSFGTELVALEKTYRIVPLGPALVVACASFPAWNVYPAVFANLMTGNPVIVKPHPSSVLQMALAVQILRETLVEFGCDADVVQLAVDSAIEPITSELATHPQMRIVDFTGSARYGAWIEEHARQARVYTETSGLNAVVLDSFDDTAGTLRAIAGAVSLFSAQMCTAPQNIYIPQSGVTTPEGNMSAAELEQGIVDAVEAILESPRRAAAVLGTIQAERTIDEISALTATLRSRARVLSEPRDWPAPGYPDARTSTPLIAGVCATDDDLFAQECFGPVVFLIRVPDARSALRHAVENASRHGAITAFLYSTNDDLVDAAEEGFAAAGASLTTNLTGAMPINFSAAFSDFHVSGLNPAGTATLTDDSFVTGRFRVVQSRRPLRSVRN
ncbi:aldehyde dehydrogenase family protein [Glaciibacter psychrotolerans]|uniref:Phenylacetic acid degradation protein paaN n=1 Tax=Glaciibacter psychrotolerans TaxID=670054 RepID=A0A7Z0J601_9MICO|nr:aldehyde dehydrogenase family protein [Leifsonia psychrotolerans]NYJ19686.1 phenylacetic acid degradation protein paaN [Leifsonia psychrotolerans]